MVSVSSDAISPSTWPSIRTAPSKASLPFTRLPLPRNALVPAVSCGWAFSRSNIFTSRGAGSAGGAASGRWPRCSCSRSLPKSAIAAAGVSAWPRPRFRAPLPPEERHSCCRCLGLAPRFLEALVPPPVRPPFAPPSGPPHGRDHLLCKRLDLVLEEGDEKHEDEVRDPGPRVALDRGHALH